MPVRWGDGKFAHTTTTTTTQMKGGQQQQQQQSVTGSLTEDRRGIVMTSEGAREMMLMTAEDVDACDLDLDAYIYGHHGSILARQHGKSAKEEKMVEAETKAARWLAEETEKKKQKEETAVISYPFKVIVPTVIRNATTDLRDLSDKEVTMPAYPADYHPLALDGTGENVTPCRGSTSTKSSISIDPVPTTWTLPSPSSKPTHHSTAAAMGVLGGSHHQQQNSFSGMMPGGSGSSATERLQLPSLSSAIAPPRQPVGHSTDVWWAPCDGSSTEPSFSAPMSQYSVSPPVHPSMHHAAPGAATNMHHPGSSSSSGSTVANMLIPNAHHLASASCSSAASSSDYYAHAAAQAQAYYQDAQGWNPWCVGPRDFGDILKGGCKI